MSGSPAMPGMTVRSISALLGLTEEVSMPGGVSPVRLPPGAPNAGEVALGAVENPWPPPLQAVMAKLGISTAELDAFCDDVANR